MAPVALLGYVALIMVIQGLERHAWWQNLCFLGSPARFWGLIYGKLAYFFKIRRFGPFWPYFGHFLANFWLIFDPPCKPSGQMLAAIFGTLNCPTHGSIILHRSQICGRMREKMASFCLKQCCQLFETKYGQWNRKSWPSWPNFFSNMATIWPLVQWI